MLVNLNQSTWYAWKGFEESYLPLLVAHCTPTLSSWEQLEVSLLRLQLRRCGSLPSHVTFVKTMNFLLGSIAGFMLWGKTLPPTIPSWRQATLYKCVKRKDFLLEISRNAWIDFLLRRPMWQKPWELDAIQKVRSIVHFPIPVITKISPEGICMVNHHRSTRSVHYQLWLNVVKYCT